MTFKEFLIDIDNFLASEQIFASYYYSYVNNVFTEKKLEYPLLVYHVDAMNHSILENSITNLKFNFFVFDKLKSDNSNIIEVQDDLLKRLIYLQFYLKRVHYTTNFNLIAVSDEAYSEKITGWIMNCEVKLDTSDESCGYVMYPRFLEDGICLYDRFEHKIIECLLPDWTEIEFPDYTYFLGNEMFPVEFFKPLVFKNVIFSGNFKMNNLEYIGDYAFENSAFNGSFKSEKIEEIGECAFLYSTFSGSLNLPMCVHIGESAFENSIFSGALSLPVCTQIGGNAFTSSTFSGSLNLPMCVHIGWSAFINSNFNEITIGANAVLGSNCIGAHSIEFIRDYALNGSMAGTYVWNSLMRKWIYLT